MVRHIWTFVQESGLVQWMNNGGEWDTGMAGPMHIATLGNGSHCLFAELECGCGNVDRACTKQCPEDVPWVSYLTKDRKIF